jgi:hypothetical protein
MTGTIGAAKQIPTADAATSKILFAKRTLACIHRFIGELDDMV